MRRRIGILMMLIAAYFIVALPFKVMQVIPGFTDVRPVQMLGPVYALFFGVPGCIVFALMNLVMDAISGELAWSSIAGMISNFAGPFLILYYWKKISKTEPHLKTFGNIVHYSIVLVIVALIEALIVTPSVAYFYPEVDWKLFFVVVTLNTSLFPILVGIPLTILIQEEFGFKQISLEQNKEKKNGEC